MTARPARPLARLGVIAVATLLLALLAAPALAHVTVNADNPRAGAFAVYTVRVPNESETGSTTVVEVQMPEGFQASRYQPKPGWAISLEDGLLTIEADGSQIDPGEFDEFRFQARNPEEPTELAFPAIQTYDDGEVVEWIGEADSDTPASVVEIVPGDGEDSHSGEGEETGDEAEAASDDQDEQLASTDDPTATGGTQPLTYAALGIGFLGLVTGGAALATRRRT